MTFKVCNLGSKYPHFNRAYVVSGGVGWTHLYVAKKEKAMMKIPVRLCYMSDLEFKSLMGSKMYVE